MAKEQADKESVAPERVRQDRDRLLRSIKKDLIAAAGQPTTALDMAEVRKKGLLAVLRGSKSDRSKPTIH
jgi:hypothetical protein